MLRRFGIVMVPVDLLYVAQHAYVNHKVLFQSTQIIFNLFLLIFQLVDLTLLLPTQMFPSVQTGQDSLVFFDIVPSLHSNSV